MPLTLIREFLRMEAAGGLVLVAAAVVALIWANAPGAEYYTAFLDAHVTVAVQGVVEIDKPLLLWINDGLMAVFFLLVGLEIKREVLGGELSSWKKAALPGIGAIGGMALPALIYVMINLGHPEKLSGWAIPAATDIAFALGVLALLGQRVPASLKVFLLALAVMDDLGAIVIIALFYTANLSVMALLGALGALAVLIALNLAGVKKLAPYILTGIVLWVLVLKSGVHATLAGVAIGFAIPMHGRNPIDESPLRVLEHALHPWVAFGILPLFAFANAGVSLAGLGWEALTHSVTLGIAAGLFIGKQAGVMALCWLAVKRGIGALPEGASWLQFYGTTVITGIGFTMSLFIGTLAFPDVGYDAPVRLGVLGGSLLSAVVGFMVLRFAPPSDAQLTGRATA